MSRHSTSKAARDNRANQLNPNHPTYHRSRGASEAAAVDAAAHTKAAQDNRSVQLNPNSDTYWGSRGQDGRPEGAGDAGEGGRGVK